MRESHLFSALISHFVLVYFWLLFMRLLLVNAAGFIMFCHGIYAQFMAHSSIHNKGSSEGLLCGATTRMASWFYAMIQVLRHKDVLKSNIHTLMFRNLVKNEKFRGAGMELKMKLF